MKVPHAARKGKLRRGLGVPWLFAAAYSAVGFSIYFSLGVVADRGLGLTPLIFLVAGLLFGLTTLSYVEGGAMFRERGVLLAVTALRDEQPFQKITTLAISIGQETWISARPTALRRCAGSRR